MLKNHCLILGICLFITSINAGYNFQGLQGIQLPSSWLQGKHIYFYVYLILPVTDKIHHTNIFALVNKPKIIKFFCHVHTQ